MKKVVPHLIPYTHILFEIFSVREGIFLDQIYLNQFEKY
jgi:hypothetical protein